MYYSLLVGQHQPSARFFVMLENEKQHSVVNQSKNEYVDERRGIDLILRQKKAVSLSDFGTMF